MIAIIGSLFMSALAGLLFLVTVSLGRG